MTRKERKRAAAAARTMNAALPTAAAETQIPAAPASALPASPVDDLREAYLQKFQPSDSIELDLVEEMITAQRRLRSLARIEDIAFAPVMSAGQDDLAAAFEKQAKLLASLDRTRKAYAQQFNRALATLKKLRALKPGKNESSLPELAAQESRTPQPQPQTDATGMPPCDMFTEAAEHDILIENVLSPPQPGTGTGPEHRSAG